MEAVVMRSVGEPEVLKVEHVPEPTLGPDDVLLDVHAVSINRTLDLAVRAGEHRGIRLPHVLGVDPAGPVLAVGSEVTDRAVGDRVAVVPGAICSVYSPCGEGGRGRAEVCQAPLQVGLHRWGGYAERVAVRAVETYLLPDDLPITDAVVVLRHGPLAFELLRNAGALQRGERVLVMGATGGLGSAGVQVAKLLGATVIAAAGAEDRVAEALANGADHGIDYRSTDLAAAVMEFTDGAGVDLVYENISDPTTWPGALASLARHGRMVTAGAHGGGIVPLDVRRLYTRRLTIVGSPDASPAAIADTLASAAAGHLRAHFEPPRPLEDAATAHRRVEGGAAVGKVILSRLA